MFFKSLRTAVCRQQSRRMASHKVEVYLTEDIEALGRKGTPHPFTLIFAGQVVQVKPGYARNFLVRFGKAVYMGEGAYRKSLPILHRVDVSESKNVSPQMVQEEVQKWLHFQPPVCAA